MQILEMKIFYHTDNGPVYNFVRASQMLHFSQLLFVVMQIPISLLLFHLVSSENWYRQENLLKITFLQEV